ncbi:hypothetical protein [Kitasatospora purpeofusca]|uniref:hypothetical protein n=1 Tax=Kitasatospora purpeofusca TaxID=67352 RepID=UPI0038685A41
MKPIDYWLNRTDLALTTTMNTVAAALAVGWAVRPATEYLALTEDGHAHLAGVGERVAAFREASAAGISPEEYRAAVGVLEQMTLNLESGGGH